MGVGQSEKRRAEMHGMSYPLRDLQAGRKLLLAQGSPLPASTGSREAGKPEGTSAALGVHVVSSSA